MTVIPFVFRAESAPELNSCFFDLAHRIWQETFKELDVTNKDIYQDYQNLDYKFGFLIEDKPIAFIGSRIFNLNDESTYKSKYFQNAGSEELREFCRNGKTLATLEYLAVDKGYRKSQGFNFGELQLGLGCKILRTLGVDYVSVLARNTRGVNGICKRLNFTPIQLNKDLFNTEVDVVVLDTKNPVKNSNEILEQQLESLYRNTEFILPEYTKVAA